ncbi:unnamed protein product [Rotaria magnacalcarata]|uniref:NHL repeat-containing protein n=1 Tax=Rotaria magnacalcarata TaxID=392030 RepID=A0A820FW58_9BILA|nr:unnamed protein product [Rotaria magnacalcarata]
MEQNKNYKALCDLISQLENQLHSVNFIEQQKAALALPKPSVSIDETKVDITITLPDYLGDVIDSHGAIVNISSTNPPIEQDSVSEVSIPTNISIEQESVSEVSISTNISANVNFERFTVVDRISTIAGGKIDGYEDGTGPNAMFRYPFGICFNPNDDCFYVCDTNNHAIRRVTLNGCVSTLVQGEITPFAGSGKGYKDGESLHASFAFPDGIAIECHSGNLFVVDASNHVIRLITPQGDEI